MRRILDTIKPLEQQQHKAKLGMEFKKDVQWWLSFLHSFNGTVFFNSGQTHHLHVDACNRACGMFWAGDWRYSAFCQDIRAANSLHINYKEVCAAVEGVRTWAPCWTNSVVIVHTDSTVTKAILNKGRSKNAYINKLLRDMFWWSVKYNFVVRAIHVPGALNTIPDTISRLHEPGKCQLLVTLLGNWLHGAGYETDLRRHMSEKSLRFLFQSLRDSLKRN